MPGKHQPEFRQRVLDLVAAGRPVVEVAHDLAVSPQTIYSWRNQDLIDIGEQAGLSSTESAELLAAGREITKLRTELNVVRRANEFKSPSL